MSSNNNNKQQQRIAVVGGGVTGLAAAWHLHVNTARTDNNNNNNNNNNLQVHLFEAQPRLGGHAYTIPVDDDSSTTTTTTMTTNQDGNTRTNQTETVDVDIGFMVYNHENYPNMVQWFQALSNTCTGSGDGGNANANNNNTTTTTTTRTTQEVVGVHEQDSDMSLSVSLDQGQTVEWNSDGLPGLFAKKSQLCSPSFYQFLVDMIRFNATAADILLLTDDDPRKHVTTKQYLRDHAYSTAFCHYYLLPMMAALWSASMSDVLQFPAVQLVSFLANHKMLQLLARPTWKTVKGRSQQYVKAVYDSLGGGGGEGASHVSVNTPIVSMNKLPNESYELFTSTADNDSNNNNDNNLGNNKSVGIFDQVIFACQPPIASRILQAGNVMNSSSNNNNSNNDDDDVRLLELLSQIRYEDNVVYVHSDPALMPVRKTAWASWNCQGSSSLLPSLDHRSKKGEAFEGGESGFGNKVDDDDDKKLNGHSIATNGHNDHHLHHDKNDNNATSHLEGKQGRMKAVYVTYWLNRLQSLDTNKDIFVSLNPHTPPASELTHKRVILAHPQFTPATLQAKEQLLQHYQGKDGLWFCGAWEGYGFHEDGCRSGFSVATQLSQVPLPWVVKDGMNQVDSLSEQAGNTTTTDKPMMVLAPPDFSKANYRLGGVLGQWWHSLYHKLSHDLPVAICKRFIYHFLQQAIHNGTLRLKFNDGSIVSFGDSSPCGCGDNSPVTMRIFDEWFFVKTALEYDLGLARSYMAGHFVIEPLDNVKDYHPVLRPPNARDETTTVLGDPVGLTRLFLLLIGNRDRPLAQHIPRKSGRQYANAMTNASGLFLAKIGSLFNYLRYKLTMDNSERGGSLKNIHAHYNLSNDLFKAFLDKETLMYSCGIWDAIQAPSPVTGLVFRGTLEEAQWRKLDNLLNRAQIQPGQTVLDIGFGWGGLCLHAARKYGCKVTGITLSVEQKALAEERVQEQGLESLITFEVVDYRTFARRKENWGKFDRVLSCEMIEAVGHEHLGEFYWAVEQVLAYNGILVMQAITTPETRYETYVRSADFINTIVFPGSCCPSLHALVDAAYRNSSLTLEHVDNIGLHYAQTLAEWRRRFNASEAFVRSLSFDDVFLRCWNWYLTYCEAGFFSQTENCLVLVFARQGCRASVPICETRAVTQAVPLTAQETSNWLADQ